MSRTDAHRPWWVQQLDHTLRHELAYRCDHSEGPCDLYRRLADPRLWHQETRCHIDYAGQRNPYGCPSRSVRNWCRRERRRVRYEWRHRRTRLLLDPDSI